MYLSIGHAKCPVYETDGARSHADASNVSTDDPSVEADMQMAVNEMESVRTCRIKLRTRNSPNMPEHRQPKCTNQWRWVGVRDTSVYIPWNAPLEALGTAN